MNPKFRVLAGFVASSVALAGAPVAPAHAELVATAQLVAAAPKGDPHRRLEALLERKEVLAELEKNGVSPAQARARVAALSDEEAQHLAEQFDRLPAGGEVIEILFVTFVVLLVTDILGYTKVFSFTRPAR